MSSLWALIPVYQGAGTLAEVVRGVQRVTGLPVVVVDDGSTDGSGERAEEAGAVVLRHHVNLGKGAALQTGFAFAEQRGARAVLTLDADSQHDPTDAPALLAAHEAQPGALVIGVRDFAAMPGRNRFGNSFSTWWISLYARRPHRDTQSGYRIYPRALYTGARLRTQRFDTETELLLHAAKLHIPLVEVPIRTVYTAARQPTHFRPFGDAMRILRLVVSSPWLRP